MHVLKCSYPNYNLILILATYCSPRKFHIFWHTHTNLTSPVIAKHFLFSIPTKQERQRLYLSTLHIVSTCLLWNQLKYITFPRMSYCIKKKTSKTTTRDFITISTKHETKAICMHLLIFMCICILQKLYQCLCNIFLLNNNNIMTHAMLCPTTHSLVGIFT